MLRQLWNMNANVEFRAVHNERNGKPYWRVEVNADVSGKTVTEWVTKTRTGAPMEWRRLDSAVRYLAHQCGSELEVRLSKANQQR